MCAGRLSLIYNTLRCDKQHSFDIAKEGYVNLLLPQHKQSRDPGDSKAMVAARKLFHNLAIYKPIADAIVNHLQPDANFLDLGCGEGSYAHWLLEQVPTLDYYGVDISRHAIKSAAKSTSDATFIVASNWHLPLGDFAFDQVLTIFAPVSQKQLRRVIKPSGNWINVTPGTDHLKELRQNLYDNVADIDKAQQFPDWQTEQTLTIKFTRKLDQPTIKALLEMTPYNWQANPQRLEQLKALQILEVTFDFRVTIRSVQI